MPKMKRETDTQIYPQLTIKNWIIENWKQDSILQEGDEMWMNGKDE